MSHSRYFLSDLHLLSRRSEGMRFDAEICDVVRKTDTFILGGDIFDFKWSTESSLQHSIVAGIDWLKKLMSAGHDTQFHYLLGNHDAHPQFVSALDQLSKQSSGQIQWHRHVLRIEESVFFHGDILDVGDCHQALDRRRAAKAEEIQSSPASHALYDAAVSMNLHRAVLPVVQPHKRVLKRLSGYLTKQNLSANDGVEHVFFGHTHRPLEGAKYNGLVYHNGGASIRGLKFRIINADAERHSAKA